MSDEKDIENIFTRIENVLSTVEKLVNEKGSKKEEKKLENLKSRYTSIKENKSKAEAIELTKTIRDVIMQLEQKEEPSKKEPHAEERAERQKKDHLPPDIKIPSSPSSEKQEEEQVEEQANEIVQNEDFLEFSEGLDTIKDLIDDTLVLPNHKEIEGKSVSEADKIMGIIEKEDLPKEEITEATNERVKELEKDLHEFKKEIQDQLEILTKRFEILKANIGEIYTKFSDETPSSSRKLPQELDEGPIKEHSKSKEEVREIFNEKIREIDEFLTKEYSSPVIQAIKAESLRISTRELIQSLPKKNIPTGQLKKMKTYIKRISSKREKIKQQVF